MRPFDQIDFRLHPLWSQIFIYGGIACGVVGVAWGLIDEFLSTNGMPIILCAVAIKFPVLGIIYKHMALNTLYANRFEVKNMYGMVWRTFHFGHIQALEIDQQSGNVFYSDKGKRQRIRHLKRSKVHPEDWNRMAEWVETGSLPLQKPKR